MNDETQDYYPTTMEVIEETEERVSPILDQFGKPVVYVKEKLQIGFLKFPLSQT